jgi:MFS family permease
LIYDCGNRTIRRVFAIDVSDFAVKKSQPSAKRRLGEDAMMRPDGPAAHESGAGTKGLDPGEKLVVLVGGVMASLAITAISAVLPTIDRALAHTATEAMLVKQLVAGVTLAMVVGAPIGGFLMGRVGMRTVLLVATFVYSISGAAGFFLSSLPALLVTRLVLGAAAATIQVTAIVLVNTRLEPEDRPKWMGLHVALATLATLVINPLSGLIGAIDWRYPFLEYLIGFVVFAALLTTRDRAPASPDPQGTIKATDKGPSIWSWFPWHYLFLSLMVGSVTFIPTIYLPFLLRDEAGLDPRGIAAYLTVAALVGGLVAMLYGRGRRYLSAHAAFLASFSLAGVGTLTIALSHALPTIVLGGIIYSAGNGWFVPNIMTALGDKVGPAQQGRAAGLVKAVHFSSAPIAVVLIEPFARAHGARMAILVACALAFLVALLMLMRMVRPRRAAAPLPASI